MKKLDPISFKKGDIPLFLFIFFIYPLFITQSNENVIFPFENKIYSFDAKNEKFETLFTSKNLFLKDFYFNNNEYFFIEKYNNVLKVLTITNYKKKLKEIFYGEYSNIIITKDYILTISKYLNNDTFEFSIYRIHNKERIYSFNLNLLLSDYEILENTIFITGSDTKDFKNYFFIIDCSNKKFIRIFEEKKSRDFFKILINKEFIYIYNSSMPEGNSNKYIYRVSLKDYKFNKYSLKIDNRYYFYGKGISVNDELFLPCINKDYDIELFNINKNFTIKKSFSLKTAIYKVLKNDNNLVYFIGYNYFKDKTKFYFCYFFYNDYKIKYLIIN